MPTPQNHPPSKIPPWLLALLWRLLRIYLLLCLLVTLFQRHLLYHPEVLTPSQVDIQAHAQQLERWRNPAGQPIGMKRLASRQPAKGQILVTYGNENSATDCASYADDLQSLGAFDVFILEYPGYEDRPGKPTETSLFHAADEALSLLSTNQPTYLVGESLGTGVTAYLAGTHPDRINGIVLLAPYNHLSAVGQYHLPILPVWLLLRDRFESDVYLRQYHGPVGIVLGTVDHVVPAKLGHKLFDGYDGPKKLWEFPHDGHNDVFTTLPAIGRQLLQFWQVK